MKPLISVLLPTRNRARSLIRALRSLQVQSWPALEILVLDDASHDNTSHTLERIASRDRRVRWMRRETSIGLADGLNALIAMSRGEWLARMDDDDISYPCRIERQLAWAQAQQVDVCGTWYRRRSMLGGSIARPPADEMLIRAELLFQPPLLHPSVMMRRKILELYGGYATDMPHAEDYELWTRWAPHVRFGNIPEVLIDYTLSAGQVSRQHNAAQVASAQRIRGGYLNALGIAHNAAQHDIHVHLRDPEPIESFDKLDAIEDWLLTLKTHLPEPTAPVIRRQWFLATVRAAGMGPETYRRFIVSPLATNMKSSKLAMLRSICTARLRYRSLPYRWLEPFATVG